MTDAPHYRALLRQARRLARRPDEAEDLLQSALLAAVTAGRADLSCIRNRAWIAGILRNCALSDARGAARRHRRDVWGLPLPAETAPDGPPRAFVQALPAALRTTALLALCGQTRAEIVWLLRLNDAALRQRIAAIRRLWRGWSRQNGHGPGDAMSGLAGPLRFGAIRQSLRRPLFQAGGTLASHDPDGNLFVLASQNRPARQLGNANLGTRD